jgi:hypothetical protein
MAKPAANGKASCLCCTSLSATLKKQVVASCDAPRKDNGAIWHACSCACTLVSAAHYAFCHCCAAAVRVQRAGRVRRFEQMTGQHFFQLFAVAFITGACIPTLMV